MEEITKAVIDRMAGRLRFEERPYHMTPSGRSGFIHRIYSLRGGEVSAVYSPPGGIGYFTDHQGKEIPFWEICCIKGNLFEDVERFVSEEEMLKRLKHLNNN